MMITGKENHVEFTEILYAKRYCRRYNREKYWNKNCTGQGKPGGTTDMGKKSNLVLIVSALLAAGVLIAGCMQDSGSLQPGESPSSGIFTPSPSSGSTETGINDRPPFNLSDAQNRTPPSGMMNGTPPGMNGTSPSDRPFGMNGTPLSGLPPSGVMNRTPHSGTPPSA